ncbi:hypothetical protein BEWA_015640 [Theileria equi strain WA]|uniref:Uncharacterized protein n=1 Tax=Theileria equi strain WA TaxID=1537102 RepID=L1LCV4_THEEQ|nr:hypothetical protein BEWA_015640 [Theileria equi strain WA]EKX73003.1 hypothetical protein BEWA_015640 [Theileria equi strain WA]|eukprot:XP_004832455.1 hypothetical protein BEWA_015640 [Theileria equi strain WA]
MHGTLGEINDYYENLSRLHEKLSSDMSDLTLKEMTLHRNFKHINQGFNRLAGKKKQMQDKIHELENMHSFYTEYTSNNRILDSIDASMDTALPITDHGRDCIEPADKDQSFGSSRGQFLSIESIATKLTEMLHGVNAACRFFNNNPEYFEANEYLEKYEIQKLRIFGIVKLIFKALYMDSTSLDVQKHYNTYRKIGSTLRMLTSEYGESETELLQLQMYYITGRVKMLDAHCKQNGVNESKNIEEMCKFFYTMGSLEVMIFYETFGKENGHESLKTLVSNISFYFSELSKRHVSRVKDDDEMRNALEALDRNMILPVKESENSTVLNPLLSSAKVTYKAIESLLLKIIHREISTKIKGYDKKVYASLYLDNSYNAQEDKILKWVYEKYGCKSSYFYPPVLYAVGIIEINFRFLSEGSVATLVSSVINSLRPALLDLQLIIRKLDIDKRLCKINEEIFLFRNLHFLISSVDERYRDIHQLFGLQAENSKRQLVSGIVDFLCCDFISFSRQTKEHDEQLYNSEISTLHSKICEKLPKIKQCLKKQAEDSYEEVIDSVIDGVELIVAEYAEEFGAKCDINRGDFVQEVGEEYVGYLLDV